MGNIVSKLNLKNILKPVVDYIKTLITNVYNSLRDTITYEKGVLEGEIDDVRSSLAGYVNNGDYNADDRVIELKHDDTVLATIDATDFIVAGMIESVSVEDVEIEGEMVPCLVITFNTEGGGHDTVNIPLTDIFDPDQYYTKTDADNKFALKNITITAGTGLTGGGSLAENRSIGLNQATQQSLAKADSAVQPVDISYMPVIHTNRQYYRIIALIENLIDVGESEMDPEDYQELETFLQNYLDQIPSYKSALVELCIDSEATILVSTRHDSEEFYFEMRFNIAEGRRNFVTTVILCYQYDNENNKVPVRSNNQEDTEVWRLGIDLYLDEDSKNAISNQAVSHALEDVQEDFTDVWNFIGVSHGQVNDFNSDFSNDFGNSATILGLIDDLFTYHFQQANSIISINEDIADILSRLRTIENLLVFDSTLDSVSTHPIENSAVYKQYMNDEDTKEIIDIVHDYLSDYLTFDIVSGGVIAWGSDNVSEIYYNKSGEFGSLQPGDTLNVLAGDKVMFAGEIYPPDPITSNYMLGFMGTTASFNVSGNILSIADEMAFEQGDYYDYYPLNSHFQYLFKNTLVLDASHLCIPFTEMSPYCCVGMFEGCSRLTKAPELPALYLDEACYQSMFQGCTSLTRAPELLAYRLVSYCYNMMFNGCSSLNYIKCLGYNDVWLVIDSSTTRLWVYGVPATGTFVREEDAVDWPSGEDGIPDGWTVETVISD